MAVSPHINILIWNANGIRHKLAELINFVKHHDIHLISISETLLNADIRLFLPGYSILRADSAAPGRGVLLAIRDDLKVTQKSLPETGHLEAVAATIDLPSGRILVASIYNSPARTRPLQRNALLKVLNLDGKVILLGDFNSRHEVWGCQSRNANGRKLLDLSIQHDLDIIFPSEPTYFPTTPSARPSTLDLMIVKGIPSLEATATTYHELDSNHNPVIIKSKMSVFSTPRLGWDLSKANWNEYRRNICEKIQIPTITTSDELDKAVEDLTTAIKTSASESIPKKRISFTGDCLPNEIKNLIKNKNRVRRSWQRHRDDSSRIEMNRLTNHIKSEIAKWRHNIWTSRISKLNTQDCSIWQFARRLKGRKITIGPLESQNGLEYSSARQVDMIADEYEKQFTNTEESDVTSSQMIQKVEEALEERGEDHPPPLIKPKDIKLAIKRVKLNKAPGYDEILPIFVKSIPGKAILYLSRVFNAMLKIGYFPSLWKKGEIVPIAKPGKDPKLASSYRPICLLPILGKLAEYFILTWLERETENKNLLPDTQFGFRKSHSAVHQVVRVTRYVRNRLQLKKATGMVLLDVAKAFDSVDHFYLASKIFLFGLPEPLCQIIGDFLRERSFRVRIANEKSEWRPIRAGVPQGALLSPLLYALYTSDMPKMNHVNIAQFADDIAIYYSNKNFKCLVRRLQEETQLVINYLQDWKLKTNPNKCEAILFTKKRKYLGTTLKINDSHLKWQSKVKYLGVLLDRRANWAAHTTMTREKARRAIKVIWPLIRPGSSLSLEGKLTLYKMLVKPILAYAVPAWLSYASRSNLEALERVQSRTLRIITLPPPGTSNEIILVGLGMQRLLDNLSDITNRFKQKTQTSLNPLILELYRT